MISSWDPGLRTGWAAWSDKGDLLEMDQCDLDEIPTVYRELETKHGKHRIVIIEDFRLFLKRAQKQAGSNMPASQGIGMLKGAALLDPSIKIVIQAPNKLQIAEKWAGVKMPGNHDESHHISAYLHGFYYLHSVGLKKSILQRGLEKNDDIFPNLRGV